VTIIVLNTYQLKFLAESEVAERHALSVGNVFSLLLLVDVRLLAGRGDEDFLLFFWLLDCLHDL
jgi:hypothetical protein